MSLTIIVENDPSLEGKKVKDLLRAELGEFAKGTAGHTLLGPILNAGGDAYSISVASGKPTATSGRSVTLNVKETKIDVARAASDLKEAVESAIFELTNATKASSFTSLETELLAGTRVC